MHESWVSWWWIRLLGITLAAGPIRGQNAENGARKIATPASAQNPASAPRVVTPQQRAEITALLARLGEFLEHKKPGSLEEFFHTKRLTEWLVALGIVDAHDTQTRQRVQSDFIYQLRGELSLRAPVSWRQQKIVRVESSAADQLTVFAQHRDVDNQEFFLRWTSVRVDGRWYLVEMEDLERGMHWTLVAGIGALGKVPKGTPRTPPQRLRAALRYTYGQGINPELADEELRQLDFTGKAPALEARRWLTLALVKLALGQYRQTLRALDQAERLGAEVRPYSLARAQAFRGVDDASHALHQARIATAYFGSNAATCEAMGRARLLLGEHDQAVLAFRDGLKDDPQSLGNLLGLGTALPKDQKDAFVRAVAAAPNGEDIFEPLATGLVEVADVAALEALLHDQEDDDWLVQMFHGEALVLRKRYEDAARRFRSAWALAGGEEEARALCQERFLDAHLLADRAVEAYQQAPERDSAFRHLAEALVESEDEPVLRGLIEAHRVHRPHDPWLHFYQGEAHLLADHHDAADVAFRTGLSIAREEEIRDACREACVEVRFLAGKGLAAYRDMAPPKATFDQLAQLMAEHEQADELKKLVEAHRLRLPADEDLPAWELELDFLHKRHEEYLRKLEAKPELWKSKQTRPLLEDRQVRCLVRLKQYAAAARVAERITARAGDPIHEALVAAAQGKVADADLLLRDALRAGHDPQELQHDPDWGPILTSAPFQDLLNNLLLPEE